LDALDVTVTNLDDELRPIITKPLQGTYYGDGQSIDLDASSSSVPGGYQTWFAVLRDDGSDPMDLVHETAELTDSFVTSSADPAYRVRLVIATPAAMPSAEALRGTELPCVYGVSQLECASTERTITRASNQPVPFELAYAFPDEVMLRFGYETPAVERSSDGGQTWQQVSLYDDWWEEYFFIDTDLEEGVTYYYRIPLIGDDVYLGQTTTAPGQPVHVPVWAAPRLLPRLDDLTWHCPSGACRWVCSGSLAMHLSGQDGASLAEATIRVFLNEPTYQRTDGLGDPLHIDWPDNLNHFSGPDVPGCVVRKAEPDLEVVVPPGQDDIDATLPGVIWGANSLRFEVEMPNGDFSERAIIVALHDDPVYDVYGDWYPSLQPVMMGTTVAGTSLTFNGLGPASRYSPDCSDGDMTYRYSRSPYYDDAIYLNWLTLQGQDPVLIGTDHDGAWSHTYGVSDGTLSLSLQGVGDSPYDEGNIGRILLDGDGNTITDHLGVYVYSNASQPAVSFTLDSAYSDLTPGLTYVVESVVIDSADPIDLGVVRFRITDADQNLDMTTVRAYNCSLESCIPGQPGETPYWGFYADNQWGGDDGHYGWFVVELPLTMANDGMNELAFCASDVLGNVLGTPTDPCVSAIVTRESPLVYASITEPHENSVYARPGAIIDLDGSSSVFPEGGVGVWTIGVEYSLILGWQERITTEPVGDPSGLQSAVVMHTGSLLGHRARIIVAATPGDLPSDYWPTDGSLPCVRSGGMDGATAPT
jgi:hypothetical protein